jgi:enamine deaminase RidA (YjgF/YER057c/UK114 family)
MIRALSLAAALAILPLSAASAQTAPADPEAAIEAAAEVFEARMEEFGERAELIAEDESLTEEQRETRIAALWAEYQPHVDVFTGVVSENAGLIAEQALAEIDVDALVAEALAGVDVDALVEDALSNVDFDVMAMAGGFASNGAWASNDPEHMATYGLMADYAMNQVDDVEVDLSDLETDLAESAQDDAD